MSTYAQPSEPRTLRKIERAKWQAFRREMIERDGGRCARCGRAETDGHVMHVHHKHYVRGRMPWQYNYNECELLCGGCHAAEHGKIPPLVGWDYQGEDDLGDLCGECDYCGEPIRYVFYIQHPKWEPLSVGTICCDHLTGTEQASNHLESLNRYKSRRTRFINSKRWRSGSWGLQITQKRREIVVEKDARGFRLVIDRIKGKQAYATVDQAKARVFEIIENGLLDKYFERRSEKARSFHWTQTL